MRAARSEREGKTGPLPFAERSRRWPWVLVAIYLALIFFLSAQSNPLPMLTRNFWDKSLHFIEYGGLGALLLFALRGSGVRPSRALLAAVALASLYGASDEVHQLFVPERSCDVRDWLADTVGAAAGACLCAGALLLHRLRASIRPIEGADVRGRD
ncbi:MAG TPA: VanZ family protein [Anaeromyxobacteraceae bacterium]|nr:VanZ family protein [Anaeromyxobacteraceae bacterium]